ncbi:MAG: hypothetical protein ACFFER_17270 [Candidatus Thorarchaeota archaeon]
MYAELVTALYKTEIEDLLEATPEAVAIRGIVGETNLTQEESEESERGVLKHLKDIIVHRKPRRVWEYLDRGVTRWAY